MADLGSSMAMMMDNPLWMQRRDILLGLGVIAVVGMLVIPLPTFLLDFLMAFSILVGMLTLLIVMFIPRAHDFAIFPSLLLISTVFRWP
jgi:flagellar biosynthesis protein FlhA